jgi:hypothetical protein
MKFRTVSVRRCIPMRPAQLASVEAVVMMTLIILICMALDRFARLGVLMAAP